MPSHILEAEYRSGIWVSMLMISCSKGSTQKWARCQGRDLWTNRCVCVVCGVCYCYGEILNRWASLRWQVDWLAGCSLIMSFEGAAAYLVLLCVARCHLLSISAWSACLSESLGIPGKFFWHSLLLVLLPKPPNPAAHCCLCHLQLPSCPGSRADKVFLKGDAETRT